MWHSLVDFRVAILVVNLSSLALQLFVSALCESAMLAVAHDEEVAFSFEAE
jgi:hypothetical protein